MYRAAQLLDAIRRWTQLYGCAPARLKHDVALRAQIAYLLGAISLQTREVAYACGVTRQTVRNWRKSTEVPRELRYEDLRISAGVEPRLVGAWLRARNRGLGYAPPLDAIRARRFGDVIAAADAFIAGSGLPVALPSRYAPSRETVAPDDPDQGLEQILAGRARATINNYWMAGIAPELLAPSVEDAARLTAILGNPVTGPNHRSTPAESSGLIDRVFEPAARSPTPGNRRIRSHPAARRVQ